jgi:hypothetical protein
METFTVHASKNGDWVETQFTGPTLTVAKANSLTKSGWDVHIRDSEGRCSERSDSSRCISAPTDQSD